MLTLTLAVGGHHRCGGLRRAGAAPDPSTPKKTVPSSRAGPDLHPAEGQHGRCYPVIFASSLLYIPQLLATVSGNTRARGGSVDPAKSRERHRSRSASCSYVRDDRLLRVLLRPYHVQPGRSRDNMKKYGLHSGYPGRQTHRAVSRLCPEPPYLPGSIYLAVVAVIPCTPSGAGEWTEFHLQRYVIADHGGCRTRYGETDRGTTANEATKGSCDNAHCSDGTAWRGQRYPAIKVAENCRCRTSPPVRSSGRTWLMAPVEARAKAVHGGRGKVRPDEVTN